MKLLHIAMGVALIGAASLALFGDKTPPGVAEPVVRAAAPAASSKGAPATSAVSGASLAASVTASAPAATAAARARFSASEPAAPAGAVTVYALLPRASLVGSPTFGEGDAVFGSQNWNPPPPPPSTAPPPPPPPPVAPMLPFSYIGKSVSEAAWEVYLSRGERTYVVRVGEVIDGTYRVESIRPPFLVLTYLPLNQTQQLNIGVLD